MTESLLRQLWNRIDARDWTAVRAVLAPDARVEFVHTGEVFDRDGWVQLNREYPGHWRGQVLDEIGDDLRAVTRTEVTDGASRFQVASFGTFRDGLIAELVEVWTECDVLAPVDLRPD